MLARRACSLRVLLPRALTPVASSSSGTNRHNFSTTTLVSSSQKLEIIKSLKVGHFVNCGCFENNETFLLLCCQGLTQAPAPALTLGLAGVIPFCAAPGYMINNGVFCPLLASWHVGYGAVILSFIGGVRWGMAVEAKSIQPSWYHFSWSVTPSLIGICMNIIDS